MKKCPIEQLRRYREKLQMEFSGINIAEKKQHCTLEGGSVDGISQIFVSYHY